MQLNELVKLFVKNDVDAVNVAFQDENLLRDFIRNIQGIQNLVSFKYGYTADGNSRLAESTYFFWINISVALDSGLDVNQRDSDGDTMILVAANGDDIELVRRLLLKGADPDIKDNFGNTARSIAVDNGYFEILEMLDMVDWL